MVLDGRCFLIRLQWLESLLDHLTPDGLQPQYDTTFPHGGLAEWRPTHPWLSNARSTRPAHSSSLSSSSSSLSARSCGSWGSATHSNNPLRSHHFKYQSHPVRRIHGVVPVVSRGWMVPCLPCPLGTHARWLAPYIRCNVVPGDFGHPGILVTLSRALRVLPSFLRVVFISYVYLSMYSKEHLSKAISAYRDGHYSSLRKCADAFSVPRSRLQNRFTGSVSYSIAHENEQYPSTPEEKTSI